ncbi:BamA/OMP85 family outer membrane protein [Rubellicoccus peritrichatus]|uniref:BamA/TamA family outer membrane protein n=1 Tax=Rubellicoccus peritrichatus TaxID=3080537 RepID=A0AAQ3L639_9BACT|nr:BamA/TamA family outer membrane protein [Puniceicoccus sp. CR14]WOO39432.1 BamA/TamA family outer membrane protein [Puniceicoccus sp. CR14]
MSLTTPAHAAALFGLIGNTHIEIDGFGFFGNIELERSLEILEPQDEALQVFDEIYLEDALWILSGEIKRRGYLHPQITASISKDNQILWEGVWSEDEVQPEIPRSIEGDSVRFSIHSGILFYYDSIEIKGIPDEITQPTLTFFYPTNRLIVDSDDRYYTPGRFQGGLDSIIGSLRDLGYRRAKVTERNSIKDEATGAVNVTATIDPGPIVFVDTLTIEVESPGPLLIEETNEAGKTVMDTKQEGGFLLKDQKLEDQRFTPAWLLSEVQTIRKNYYTAGYPEVAIERDFEFLERSDERVVVQIKLIVAPGEQIHIADVKFEGTGKTNQALLERQANLKDGELLNRSEVERGRDKLSRLGIFRDIKVNYEDIGGGQWDVIYDASLKRQTAISLIAGVGSFDIVRGGFEIAQRNLWGLAHQSRLTAIQSFKATYADYTYTIPQVFGDDTDFFLSADYLRREEISFDRVEYGGTAGLQRYFSDINTTASAAYSYGLVDAKNTDFAVSPGPTRSLVSSVIFKANKNELDNPVFPTRGWQVFGTSEFAFTQLGGEVNFQRIEVGGAWHHPLDSQGLVLHTGLKHGVVTSVGSASENIPVPKRFFLGGENTVRGYRRDQASPVNSQGQEIGAVSYLLWQGELEQRLTELISVVGFVDAVGNAEQISEYPFNEVLVSVGVGISLRTVVGPLRFEYGHNVKKRTDDPNGTFQVALGFPF